jgi:protein-tyrosine-phosphatase
MNGAMSKPDLPKSILFMCGQNAIRSPMAEVLTRAILPKGIFIASAGVLTGARDPFVEVVLNERNLSLGKQIPQTLDELEDAFFDLIVTLSPEAHHAALELTRTMPVEVEYWPTFDPSGEGETREQKIDAYRTVRNALEQRINARFGPSELLKSRVE